MLENLRLSQLKSTNYHQLYQTCCVSPTTIVYDTFIEKQRGSTKKLPYGENNRKDFQVVEDKEIISINLV